MPAKNKKLTRIKNYPKNFLMSELYRNFLIKAIHKDHLFQGNGFSGDKRGMGRSLGHRHRNAGSSGPCLEKTRAQTGKLPGGALQIKDDGGFPATML
jgi:hypothetical protein